MQKAEAETFPTIPQTNAPAALSAKIWRIEVGDNVFLKPKTTKLNVTSSL